MSEKSKELFIAGMDLFANAIDVKRIKDFLKDIPDNAVFDIYYSQDYDRYELDAVWQEADEKTQELPKDLSAVNPKYILPPHFKVARPNAICTHDCKYNGFKTHIPGCGIYAKD